MYYSAELPHISFEEYRELTQKLLSLQLVEYSAA